MSAHVSNALSSESNLVTVPWERIERFVGQLTHDVRNGLNALELQLTFLGEISKDPEAVAEVKLIRGTLADITKQLQAIRQSTGAVVIHSLDYPATEFFEDLRERFERIESASKDRVRWEINVGNQLLAIDPEASMSVFLELLANALRFGDANSTVMFVANAKKSGVNVSITEALTQPPVEDLAGWGLTPLLTTQRSAYGLGLFRARRTLETQGGMLEAEYASQERLLTTKAFLPLAARP